MTSSEFVNKCDRAGGLYNLFETGVSPHQIESTAPLEFRCALYLAYEAYQDFKRFESKYYAMVEECKHE